MNSQFLAQFADVAKREHVPAWRGRVLELTTAKQHLDDIWKEPVTERNALRLLQQTCQVIDVQQFNIGKSGAAKNRFVDLVHLIPRTRFIAALEEVTFRCGANIIRKHYVQRAIDQFDAEAKWSFADDLNFMALVESLRNVDLWGTEAAAASAQAITRLLDVLVHQLCIVASKSSTISKPASQILEQIVKVYFEPMVKTLPFQDLPLNGVDYCGLASLKLAQYRSQDFFEMIQSKHTNAAHDKHILEDIRARANDPTARRFFLEELTLRLKKELLQPGCATVQILDCFIRAVHRVRSIDPHGSLLNEISKTFRSYVKLRDDAVRIMLLNFLEGCKRDGESTAPSWAEYSHGVANSVKKEAEVYAGDYFEGADLRDLDWQPEPVDASFGHQAAKNLDDLGHLIKLAEQKVFITELQLLFRARLLGSAGSEYVQELDLLQMLKRRFDHEGAFQNVEVMLNDVLQSHRLLNEMVNEHKNKTFGLPTRLSSAEPEGDTRALFSIPFNAHILSRAYWANIESADFNLPDVMNEQISVFEAKFKTLHQQKQLQWAKQLGHVLVELEFADRTFSREVSPAQAAVIAAFSTAEDSLGSRKKEHHTLQELQAQLSMEESLLRSCLLFWISQEVLAEAGSDAYRVIEDLSKLDSSEQVAAVEASIATDSHALESIGDANLGSVELKSTADLLRENGLVYGNFIAALLTNQGGMPAPRIHMILTNMMPGGFPFAVQDLIGFLREMAGEGESGNGRIENVAGNWRIKKK